MPKFIMILFSFREYFEILDETVRTNPYRKAATAMASVMNKHGIASNASSVLGKPAAGLPEKKCALTRSLLLAQNCNQKLNVTRDELQALCCDLGIKFDNSSSSKETEKKEETESDTIVENPSDRAVMTGHLLTLIGEAQTIAKRIYETAVGLHVAEDYLRQPDDLRTLDFSASGRIQIPNYNFNHASQLCLEWLHSTATKWLRGFKEDGGDDNIQFIKVFENFTKAVKDYTEAVCLANQVFRVLLYPNAYGKECLQEYVLSLGHVLKNDIMMEIQSLRRAFDSIQYSFERLGWAASIAWMKYSGKNITVETLNETGIQVDHSMFQHKFYEGPSKLKKKGTGSCGKCIKPKTMVTKLLLPKSNRANTGENKSETATRKQGSAISIPVEDSNNNLINTLSVSRMTRSTIEVSKTKKPPLRMKGKAKQGDQKMLTQVTSEAAVIPTDDATTRASLLKLLISENSSSTSRSSSQLDFEPSNNLQSKSTPLTPPPNIPPAWRKQFGAVFGAHLMPPKAPAKKGKKKINASGASSSTSTKLHSTSSLSTRPRSAKK